MAELTTLARPYAKAAFEYARSSNNLDAWSKALATLSAVTENEKVDNLLNSVTMMAEQKAAALKDICGESLDAKIHAFVDLLAENRRLGLITTIHFLFENLKAQQEKFSDVEVISAFALDSTVEKALAEKLKTVLISDVSLKTTVDTSLLGGVVIRSGDTVIDASVKGRLSKLAENFGL